MGNTGTKLTPDEIALLKFNYEKLHEAVWDNHKVSWTVTSLYLPLIFAAQGLLVKMFFEQPSTSEFKRLNEFIIVGAIGIIIATFVWWLILHMFSEYNDLRRNRLKAIENTLSDKEIMPYNTGIDLIRQYSIDYSIKVKLFKGSHGFKIGFDRLYTMILLLIVAINLVLIGFVLVRNGFN